MKEKKISKFESESRVRALDPKGILEEVGFGDGMTLCDIGSGTGLFVFEAAGYKSDIYSVDASETMLEIQRERIAERGLENVRLIEIDVEGGLGAIEESSCDVALLVTVLHEVEDKLSLLREIKRILKCGGRLMVIEFKKQETGFGPPLDIRIEPCEIEDLADKAGIDLVYCKDQGGHFYKVLLQKP